MTTAERNIADRLAGIKVQFTREGVFIAQLKNWHDRSMTHAGRAMMLRLLSKYQAQIPDHSELRSAYTIEALQRLAP